MPSGRHVRATERTGTGLPGRAAGTGETEPPGGAAKGRPQGRTARWTTRDRRTRPELAQSRALALRRAARRYRPLAAPARASTRRSASHFDATGLRFEFGRTPARRDGGAKAGRRRGRVRPREPRGARQSVFMQPGKRRVAVRAALSVSARQGAPEEEAPLPAGPPGPTRVGTRGSAARVDPDFAEWIPVWRRVPGTRHPGPAVREGTRDRCAIRRGSPERSPKAQASPAR